MCGCLILVTATTMGGHPVPLTVVTSDQGVVADRKRPPGLIGKSGLAYYRGVSDASEPERDAARDGDVFKALADPTRRKILDELAERDGQTLFEICSRLTMKHRLGLSRQAISQHLEVLIGAGLVTSHREGRYKFHYIDTGPLQRLTDRWRNRETKEN